MKVYSYDRDTGEYVGSEIADESPLEPGIYLIPANSTIIKPPKIKKGFVPVWSDSSWKLTEDNRGKKYWLPGESTEFTMNILGSLPENAIFEKPKEDINILTSQIRLMRNAKLYESDWTQSTEDCPLTKTQKTKWKKYRQQLRDIPTQEGFPENVIWPEKP